MHRALLRSSAQLVATLASVLAIGLMLVLPCFDHHAVERDPGHGHADRGQNDLDWLRFLVRHDHAHERPHYHALLSGRAVAVDPDDGPHHSRVVAVRHHDDGAAAVPGTAGTSLLTPFWTILLAMLAAGARLSTRAAPLFGIVVPVPIPPPRSSF